MVKVLSFRNCTGGALELAIISNNTSVDAGETAVLICVGFGQPRADITWTRDGQEISNRSLVTIYEEDLAQGGRVFKQSFLQLCSLRMSNSGVYTCSVSNGLSSVNSSLLVTVNGEFIHSLTVVHEEYIFTLYTCILHVANSVVFYGNFCCLNFRYHSFSDYSHYIEQFSEC